MKRKLAIIITTVAIFITFSKVNQFKDENLGDKALDYKSQSENEIANEDKKSNDKEEQEETKQVEETEQVEDSIADNSNTEETENEFIKGNPATLPEILMTNIWLMTDDAISAVEFEESINLIKNNPEIFLDDSAADSLINMFNHVYWDELYVDAKTPQPITMIEGQFMREFNASFDSDKYNVFQVGFFPNPKKDDVPVCTVFYCGNIRDYLFPGFNGQKYMKIWALPVGVYELKRENGETYTTYIYVSSETFQHTAYNYFGEWRTH